MKTLARLFQITLLVMLFANSATAQTEDDYHPFLSDKFNLDIGFFWPQINFNAQVDGSNPDEEIDFDEDLNLSDNQSAGAVNFRWRFGKKWSLWGQYWSTDHSGKAILDKDVEWEDVVFKEGTFAAGGVSLDVVRVFFGRQFDLSPQHEFGVGAGFHWMDLDTFLEGEIIVNDTTTEFRRVSVSAAFPLPNIGAWYMYSWSPKWMASARVDWLSASIGNYSGSLWHSQVGVNYQAFKNFGFGLYYKAFSLDVDVDKSDWRGRADLTQHGPLFAFTATW